MVKWGRGDDPRRIGRYRVERKLGAGGMGSVYLGVGKKADRPVAIKVIRSEHATDPMFRARFRREVAAAQRVRRFCTAPIIDADPDANPPYLVTEFVNGPSLHDLIATDGPLHGADLEALAVGVVAALTAIHDAGVVHRDLKPANVLLSPFGPRVIDFGVARVMDLTRLSVDSAVLGTPAYMAPEQVQGSAVTAAADVFAWGAVVAFAARGQPPFSGESPAALMHQILTGVPALDDLDGELCDQVRAAMSKAPDRRPTAHDILRSLISNGAPATSHVLDAAPMGPPADREAHRAKPSSADGSEAWYRRAAEAGDVAAMLHLGDLVQHSNRVDEAEHWYRKAAESGNTAGMRQLGMLLADRGDYAEAEYWYRTAIEAGDVEPMDELGNLFRTRKEYAEAERWFRKAIDTGSIGALSNLGVIYHERGQFDEAERWYRKAIDDAGVGPAMNNLGQLYEDRSEFDEAERWYRKAIDGGSTPTMTNLGMLLERRGDDAGAEHWYRKAAEAGDTLAMIKLGNLLRTRDEKSR